MVVGGSWSEIQVAVVHVHAVETVVHYAVTEIIECELHSACGAGGPDYRDAWVVDAASIAIGIYIEFKV